MFRIAPFKINSSLTDVEAKVTLLMVVEENGKSSNEFFNLKLEVDKVNALPLSWTIVHPIDEESPLYKFSKADILKTKGEIIVFIKAFDETFSNNVIARTSYTFDELDYGKKFVPMYKRDITGSTTVIHLDKLNDTIDQAIPDKIM
jgi:Inward rectifier potassium channel C-terminal domain